MKTLRWVGVAAAASVVMALGCGKGEDRHQTVPPGGLPTEVALVGDSLNTTLLALIPVGRDVGAELMKIGKPATQTGVTITYGASQEEG